MAVEVKFKIEVGKHKAYEEDIHCLVWDKKAVAEDCVITSSTSVVGGVLVMSYYLNQTVVFENEKDAIMLKMKWC